MSKHDKKFQIFLKRPALALLYKQIDRIPQYLFNNTKTSSL